jgi:membrane protein
MKTQRFKNLFIECWNQFRSNRVLDQSAKLAFYFLLSIFPLMIFLVMILGLVLQSGPDLQETLTQYLSTVAPESASKLIKSTLDEITKSSSSAKLSFALVFTWWSASRAMLAIIEGINIAYEIQETRSWWKKYLLASVLTFGAILLNSLTIIILIYGGPLTKFLLHYAGVNKFLPELWPFVQWGVLLLLVLVVFNSIYRFAPNEQERHASLIPGTIVGVSTWLLASFGFKLYLNYFNNFSVTYGSIGAVIIMMLWFYYSGVSVLLGAIVNAIIRRNTDARLS